MKSAKLPLTVALLAALAYIASILFFARQMPEYVATHFDATGRPNGWMNRDRCTLFNLGVGLGVQFFMAGMCYLTRYVSPKRMNIPNKQYWHQPEHYREACDILFRQALWLGSILVLWLVLLNYEMLQANLAMPPHFEPTNFIVAMATFSVVLIGWLILLLRLYRVPATARAKGKAKR